MNPSRMNVGQLPFFEVEELRDWWRGRPVRDVHGLARYNDPPTSIEAAQKISGRTERLIAAVFASTGRGFTDDELAAELPTVHGPTVKSARSRLARQGRLEDSGERRASRTGSPMIVWRMP